MRIKNISADVRIISYENPFDLENNVFVEHQGDKGVWQVVWKANELSNEFAYSEAVTFARELAAELRSK